MLRNILVSSSAAIVILAAARSNAQEPAQRPPPPPQPPPVEQISPPAPAPTSPGHAPAPAPAPPPAPVPGAPLATPPTPPPPPEPPPKKDGIHLPPVRFYGTFKPTLAVSARAVESFSNPNASAITAAANPVTAPLHRTPRLSFQVAQSRFGFYVNEKGLLRAHLEIDFFDSAKATPTVASTPRLRIATVDWAPSEHFAMSFGQDWDLHAPLNPYTTNLVGALFEAGNVGFMRQQIKAFVKNADFELGAALGIQAPNPTPKDNNIEIGHFPSFAARAAALVGKTGRIGVSGIATQFTFSQGLPTERKAGSLGAAAFADVTPYEALNVRFEGYIGRNQANTGMLALGQGGVAGDIDELGGFISGHHNIVAEHAIYATAGFAQILNPGDVKAAYTYPAPAAGAAPNPAPDTATAISSGAGPGMRWNWAARLGYEYRPVKAITFVVEGFVYQSRHVLQPVDDTRFEATQIAPGVESGFLYTF
jgi:hypothetical protein